MAATRVEERLLASLGQLQAAPIRFEAVSDVPKGGVLCALPALLALGLLRHSRESFSLPAGYYPVVFGQKAAWRANQELRECFGVPALVEQNCNPVVTQL